MKFGSNLAALTLAAALLTSTASFAGNYSLQELTRIETNGGRVDKPHEEPKTDPRDNGEDQGTTGDDPKTDPRDEGEDTGTVGDETPPSTHPIDENVDDTPTEPEDPAPTPEGDTTPDPNPGNDIPVADTTPQMGCYLLDWHGGGPLDGLLRNVTFVNTGTTMIPANTVVTIILADGTVIQESTDMDMYPGDTETISGVFPNGLEDQIGCDVIIQA